MPHERLAVYSSWVDGIQYNEETAELSVFHKNGSRTVYSGVPADTYQMVSQSPSIGQALHAHVRGNFAHRTG